MYSKKLINSILNIKSDIEFNEFALKIFFHQYNNNAIYRQFVDLNHIEICNINEYTKIPFLPIDFFKYNKIFSKNSSPVNYFESSGTTGMERSKHYYSSLNNYEQSFIKGFNYFYGDIKNYCLLAVLPNYLEQKHSSLIYMIDKLIYKTTHKDSGFYLNNLEELSVKLLSLQKANKKTILFGVTYALLDLAEKFPIKIPDTIIFETGGMKGRRKEMIREEIHNILENTFEVTAIHGEYGMTELFSQAYSKGNGIFNTPPWMKILIRDINDPFTILKNNKTGGINVIDLANIDSCSFIATQDLGKKNIDDSFEITGRFDNSDIRGCNLMVL